MNYVILKYSFDAGCLGKNEVVNNLSHFQYFGGLKISNTKIDCSLGSQLKSILEKRKKIITILDNFKINI